MKTDALKNAKPYCPNCGELLQGFSTVTDEDSIPVDGDVSICLYCQAVSLFNSDLSLRAPTEQDILELPLLEIGKAQKVVTRFKEEK